MSSARIQKLVDAIVAGDAKKVSLYLKAGVPADGHDEGGDSFLSLAARFAEPDIFELLLEKGADIYEPELLEWAVDGDGGRRPISPQIAFRILEQGEPNADEINAALRIACVGGNMEVIGELLRRGADANAYDSAFFDFPLLNAVTEKHVDVVTLLLEHGADPTRYLVKVEDDEGEIIGEITLLEHAKKHSTQEIEKSLANR